MVDVHIDKISKELSSDAGGVRAVASLLEKGATVPFIARYRKELISGFTITNSDRAIFAWTSSPTVTNCVLTGNESGVSTAAGAVITGNLITGNTDYGIFASYSSSSGLDPSPTITNNLIVGNLQNGLTLWHTGGRAVNNTIDANVSSGLGGSLPDSVLGIDLRNNIVTNNGIYGLDNHGGAMGFGEGQTIGYNNVWGSTAQDYFRVEPGLGSISADPRFVQAMPVPSAKPAEPTPLEDAAEAYWLACDQLSHSGSSEPTAGGMPSSKVALEDIPEFDYSLKPGSPCIDAGDPEAKYLDVNGTRNDMGALGGPTPIGSEPGPGPQPPTGQTISGQVTEADAGLEDVTVALSGAKDATATTDADGKYSFADLADGSYTVTPTGEGYTFTPESVDVTVSGADVTDQDFVGTAEAPEPGVGEVGPLALELDLTVGHQAVYQTTTAIKANDPVVFEIVATDGASGAVGVEAILKYDKTKLQYTGAAPSPDMFPDALALPMPAEEGTGVNVASTGNGAPKNAGSIAQVTFTALVDLGDATTIVLTAGKYSTGGATQSLEIGSGGATLVVGGTPVQAEKTPDFTGDGKVDFSDFVQFAQNFGKSQGDPGYDARFDLNDDNKVDFGDFVTFAQSFGRPVTKPVGQAEPVGSSPGLNADADLSLVSEPGEVCDEVTVLVRLSNATQVSGYSLKLVYDPSSLEWLGSEGAVASLFTDDGGVALDHRPQPGNATLADMLDAALSNDDAELVRIRFRVIGTTPGSVVIQEALVSDISGRIDRLTGARLDGIRALPSRYAVLQNAPNPFNPSTEIAFQLPEAGEVSLAVYNLLGQQVRTLAAGRHHAGYHRVVWDGRDAAGRSVSSGVYLYRFVSEGLTETRQMLLLK